MLPYQVLFSFAVGLDPFLENQLLLHDSRSGYGVPVVMLALFLPPPSQFLSLLMIYLWVLGFGFPPFHYLLKQVFLNFNNSTDFVHQESLHLL